MARIAFVLPDLSGGGAERVALTLVEALQPDGHDIDLVLAKATGELISLVPHGVRVVDLRAKRLRNVVLPLSAYFREQRPDAVQVSMWPLTALSVLARRLARVPMRLVVSDHGILSKQYAHSRAAMAGLKWSLRLLYPSADARIAVSEECAADLAALSALPVSAFTVIPNPIGLPGGPVAATAEVERQWPPGKRILTVGNLIPVKNQRLLIQALAEVNGSLEAGLLILGEGELRQELQALARDVGLAERVVMPGYVIDPWPYYASADVFALSSDHEAYPGVLLEALQAGLPIVSTDCGGGPRDILGDGAYGALAPVGDVSAFAASILDRLARKADANILKMRAESLSGAASIARYRDLLCG